MRLLNLVPLLLAVEYRVRLGPISFAVAELAVVLVWLLAWRRVLAGRPGSTPGLAVDMYLVLLVVLFALPGLIFDLDSKHAVSAMRDLVSPFLLFLGLRTLQLEERETRRLAQVYVGAAIASSILGIIQFRTGQFAFFESPDAAAWEQYKLGFIVKSVAGEWLGAKDALSLGFFSHPNNFGSYVTIPLVITFSVLVLASGHSAGRRWLNAVGVLLMSIALLGTFFRSGIVIVLLSMAVLGGIRRHHVTGSWRTLVAVGSMTLVLVGFMLVEPGVLAFDQFGTLRGRSEMIQHAWQVIQLHPWMVLTGGLTDDYRRLFDEPQEVHNWLLYCVLRFGVFTTACVLAFYGMWIRRLVRLLGQASNEKRAILAGIVLGLVGNIFVYGLTTSFLDNVSTSLGLMFWFGIGAAIYSQERHPSPSVAQRNLMPR